MSTPHRVVAIAAAAAMLMAGSALGQSLQQRIADHNRRQRQQQQSAADARAQQQATINQRMNEVMTGVRFENTPLREALTWWSQTANVPIVVNWQRMRNAGIDEDMPVNLILNYVPAQTVLQIIIGQMTQFEGQQMIAETTPWYVQIMTREEALSQPVTRVYDMADLLMDVPNFSNAPSFNLEDALGDSQGTTGGGGAGGGGSAGGFSLFGGDDDDDDDDNRDDDDDDDGSRLSRAQRGQQIAQLIRDSIEPDIWYAHGGQFGSVRVFQHRLIVTAAPFVQRQIGGAVGGSALGPRTYRVLAPSPGSSPSTVSGVQEPSTRPRGRKHDGVSGVTD